MTPEVQEHAAPGISGVAEPSRPQVPDACQAELGWGLGTVARAFGQWAAAALDDLPGGARGHLVLTTISRGRPASQLALANELGVDRTVMTYLLDELERAGLLERRPDPADRRARQVLITPAGKQAATEYRSRLTTAEQQLLEPLDEHEAQAFRSYLERLARAAQSSANRADDGASCDGPAA